MNFVHPKTLTRKYDHVVVKGKKLTGSLNGKISSMTLYAYKDGKMSPIPFQIDEINYKNNWVLPNASPYKEDQKGGTASLLLGTGLLKVNDELVFMIQDAGDKAPTAAFPSGFQGGDEITLQDPVNGGQGWVYLFTMDRQVPNNPSDYVNYDLKAGYKKDLIRAQDYTIGFNPQVPITYALVDLNDPAGKMDNLVDRMKMRISGNLFGFIKTMRTEEDMESRLWQYKDGPVRVIRMIKSSIRMIGNLQSPEVKSYSLYYKNAVHLPFRVSLPFEPSLVVKNIQFIGGVDCRSRYGYKVLLNTDSHWLNVDGKMDNVEQNIKFDGAKWFTLIGSESTFLLYIQGLEKHGIKCRFNYSDDDQTPAPPEFEKGQVPFVGFNGYGMEKLKQGIVEFNVLVYLLNEKICEDEVYKLIEVMDNPVEVKSEVLK